MAKTKAITKYGCQWNMDPLAIELWAIQHDGRWTTSDGAEHGEGLVFHYLAARALLWPKRYRHRWTDLIYEQVLTNQIVIAMGPASSQKTSHFSEIILIAYWAFPETTAVLVSTISMDKLESSVFGEIKMLFRQAHESYAWLAGHLVDHKKAILTDNIKAGEVRDFRRGIVGKALYVGQKYVGLGVFAGIKQERLWFLADELQYCPSTFLDCLPNMRSNTGAGGLHILGSGNPNHDPESQLGVVAEPLEGWGTAESIEKTTVWPIKLTGGVCLNLIGTDSPNFDGPADQPDKYHRLIGREFERIIAHDYGRNSPTYETQVMGRMKLSLAHSRVITRQLCRAHHAHDMAMWIGSGRTRIYALDPAYGGGDRCVAIWGEFGLSDKGKLVLRLNPPRVIKIDMKKGLSPEDQIAEEVHRELIELSIPPENAFYDSFGKGTIGFAFARKFGANSPVPVDSGAQPSKRPVRQGLFVDDTAKEERRLKTCAEHYSKFVTEMWFSVRYMIEAEQMRELPMDVMAEGCWREYYTVAGDKLEVEPKDKMKERTGKSPDLFDATAILVEGARRRGFVIDKLGESVSVEPADDFFEHEANEYQAIIQGCLLQHQ